MTIKADMVDPVHEDLPGPLNHQAMKVIIPMEAHPAIHQDPGDHMVDQLQMLEKVRNLKFVQTNGKFFRRRQIWRLD